MKTNVDSSTENKDQQRSQNLSKNIKLQTGQNQQITNIKNKNPASYTHTHCIQTSENQKVKQYARRRKKMQKKVQTMEPFV